MENLTAMARHLVAPTVAMHPRKIDCKDQGSPYRPDKTGIHPFSFREKVELGQLLCPNVIEQIDFHFRWKMDGRSLESLRCKLSIWTHISIAFTWKQNVSQLLDIQKKDDDPWRRVQDNFLLMKFPWQLLRDVIYQVYQRQIMPETSIALHFLLKTWLMTLIFFSLKTMLSHS